MRKCALFVVCLFAVAVPASAQDRGWLDINFGGATSSEEEVVSAFAGFLYTEPAALAAAYDKLDTGGVFDVGGGFMFTPIVGLGASLSGQAHTTTAGLAITIPHPYFFNASDTDGDVTEPLERSEGAFHILAMVNALRTDRVRLRVFGGPSYFNVSQEVVSDIRYTQFATPFSRANIVTITGFDKAEVDGSGWGFNVGTDLGFFFSRVVGVGLTLKYAKASVEIHDPLSELDYDLTAGGTVIGGGLRLRF